MDDLSTTHNPDVLPEQAAEAAPVEANGQVADHAAEQAAVTGFSADQAADEAADEAAATEVIATQVDPEVPVADPGSDTVQAPAPDLPPPVVKVKRKRSISTPALYSVLLVIGLVGGIGAGYAVQAQRKPTPLPPLAATPPKYPMSPLFVGQLPVALPSADDDATLTNGDLTKLLPAVPSGSTAIDAHVWMTLADAATYCDDQASCFTNSLSTNVSRIADSSWTMANGDLVEVRITQYAAGFSSSASAAYNDFTSGGADGSTALTLPADIPVSGSEFPADANDDTAVDYAVALHGNLLIDFWVNSASAAAPDPSIINGLITQQMARL